MCGPWSWSKPRWASPRSGFTACSPNRERPQPRKRERARKTEPEREVKARIDTLHRVAGERNRTNTPTQARRAPGRSDRHPGPYALSMTQRVKYEGPDRGYVKQDGPQRGRRLEAILVTLHIGLAGLLIGGFVVGVLLAVAVSVYRILF